MPGLCHDGVDPIERRHNQRGQAKLDAARQVTFADCAEKYIEAHSGGWRNSKHRDQWRNTLKTYAEPVLGALLRSVDHMLWSIWSWRMSAESRITICLPVFFHQCEVAAVSAVTSPALCTIGTEQLLAYSTTSPWMM